MENVELSKFFKGEIKEFLRSEIQYAYYNPRMMPEESKKALKRGIKKFGLLGGLIINTANGNTIIQGHQRIDALDYLHKYDPQTHENDYKVRAEATELSEAEEKELNVLLNNPNAQGVWDYDALRELIASDGFDYKVAELTDADLSMIGVDNMFQTEAEKGLADAFDDLLEEQRADNERQKAERAEIRQAQKEANAAQEAADEEREMARREREEEMTRQAKIDHMKEVKSDVRNGAIDTAANMEAYLMISFSTFDAKAAFCEKMGYDPMTKFIKGEEFDSRIDFEDDEEPAQ